MNLVTYKGILTDEFDKPVMALAKRDHVPGTH